MIRGGLVLVAAEDVDMKAESALLAELVLQNQQKEIGIN
jgi:hypothetical protein